MREAACRIMSLSLAAVAFFAGWGQPSWAATKLRFGDVSTSATSWPMMIAQEKGFFAKEGLDVDVTYIGNNAAVVQQLIGGSFDLGLTTLETTVRAVDKGAPVVMTASIMLKYAYSIIADKSIKSVKDMKGKRIILALPKSALTVFWNRALAANGLKVSDVEQVYDGSTVNRFAALTSGSVQAAALSQPMDLLSQDKGYNKIVDITDYAKDFGFTGVVTTRSWLKGHGDDMRAFLRALKAGVTFLYDPANRTEAAGILAKDAKIDRGAAEETYDDYAGRLRPYDPNIAIGDASVRAVVELLNEIGDTKIDPIDPRKYADPTFLPQ